MRDVSVDEFAEELRDALRDVGVEISKGAIQVLTRQFFFHAEKLIMEGRDERLSMYNRDIAHIFNMRDAKQLCDEFAHGEGIPYDRLLKRNKLSKRALLHLKRKMKDTIE